MRYTFDNDLHIHSGISLCSNDEAQTPDRILQYAKENNLKTICIADHFWDETIEGASQWYSKQDYAHIAVSKPLPQADGIQFLFGCETDLNKDLTLGVSKERYDLFDFIVIPTTHFHMRDFTLTAEEKASAQSRAKMWVKRFDAVLDMDLPFYKVGIAHLACHLIAESKTQKDTCDVLNLIPDEEMERLFTKAAKLGVGIELNSSDMNFNDENAEAILRPFKIAKKCGCKFYMGSDAHHPEGLDKAAAIFNRAIDLLELTEEDKFVIMNK